MAPGAGMKLLESWLVAPVTPSLMEAYAENWTTEKAAAPA